MPLFFLIVIFYRDVSIGLDYQPLFGKGARAPPPNSVSSRGGLEKAPEIEPMFPFECHKTKSKLIPLTNYKGHSQSDDRSKLEENKNTCSPRKARENVRASRD